MARQAKGVNSPSEPNIAYSIDPTYAINLYRDDHNQWVGHFISNGRSIFDTGIPNSFAYVFARLEPWFAQAPNTVEPK